MDFNKITSITLALLEMKTDINEESKAGYVKKVSATFNIPEGFLGEDPENMIAVICASMYIDVSNKINEKEVDSLGIWVTYDGKVYENSIKLKTLDDIVIYSPEQINPTFEFLKMTIN